jgi:hypothetical protein
MPIMRREAVFAFQKRRLRAGVSRRAGHQYLAGNANIERKTDTMKEYILLKAKSIQNQLLAVSAGAKPFVLFVGLVVHGGWVN